MADDSVCTIRGIFATREAADRAVERLVQEHGINRADVFVEPVGPANSAGTEASGPDRPAGRAEVGGQDRSPPALAGAIAVSADVAARQRAAVESALREAGAQEVGTR